MTYLNWIYTYIQIYLHIYIYTHLSLYPRATFTNPSKEAVIKVDDWESNAISMMTWMNPVFATRNDRICRMPPYTAVSRIQNQIFEGDKEKIKIFFVCALLWELNFWKGNLEAKWCNYLQFPQLCKLDTLWYLDRLPKLCQLLPHAHQSNIHDPRVVSTL